MYNNLSRKLKNLIGTKKNFHVFNLKSEPKDIVLSLCGGLMNRRIAPGKTIHYLIIV